MSGNPPPEPNRNQPPFVDDTPATEFAAYDQGVAEHFPVPNPDDNPTTPPNQAGDPDTAYSADDRAQQIAAARQAVTQAHNPTSGPRSPNTGPNPGNNPDATQRRNFERPQTEQEQNAASLLADLTHRISQNRILSINGLRRTLNMPMPKTPIERGALSDDDLKEDNRREEWYDHFAWTTIQELVSRGILTTNDPRLNEQILDASFNSDVARNFRDTGLHYNALPSNGVGAAQAHANRLASIRDRRPSNEFMTVYGHIAQANLVERTNEAGERVRRPIAERRPQPTKKAAEETLPEGPRSVYDIVNAADQALYPNLARHMPGTRFDFPRWRAYNRDIFRVVGRQLADQFEQLWGDNYANKLREELRQYEPTKDNPGAAGERYGNYAAHILKGVAHLDRAAKSGNMIRRDWVVRSLIEAFHELEQREERRQREEARVARGEVNESTLERLRSRIGSHFSSRRSGGRHRRR